MNSENQNQPITRETDYLRYRGNSVPRFLRLIWTLLILFCIFYMVKWAWPDLANNWLNK